MTRALPGLDPTTVGLESVLHVSQRYLASAYDSVASLIETTYPILREQREADRGRLTHAEQDLFRAAVVFAGAGVDAVLKQTLRAAVPVQIKRSAGAREKYVDFVSRQIQDNRGIDAKVLARLLVSDTPQDDLLGSYIEFLTGSSLQSRTQVTSSLAALGLQADRELFKDASNLDDLFRTRNQIAHEMDMTPAGAEGRGKRTRRDRAIQRYVDMCHQGLNYSQRVLNRLESDLKDPGN